MVNYTAADIKALHKKTGTGMLDVKKALDEANGDQQKAAEIIRVKGLKGITKREGRATAEGLVAARVENGVGYMIEVNSETDFVTKSDPFIAFGQLDAESLLNGDYGYEITYENDYGPNFYGSLSDKGLAFFLNRRKNLQSYFLGNRL